MSLVWRYECITEPLVGEPHGLQEVISQSVVLMGQQSYVLGILACGCYRICGQEPLTPMEGVYVRKGTELYRYYPAIHDPLDAFDLVR